MLWNLVRVQKPEKSRKTNVAKCSNLHVTSEGHRVDAPFLNIQTV